MASLPCDAWKQTKRMKADIAKHGNYQEGIYRGTRWHMKRPYGTKQHPYHYMLPARMPETSVRHHTTPVLQQLTSVWDPLSTVRM